jgi:FAD/FMN-containing dehydrogenase
VITRREFLTASAALTTGLYCPRLCAEDSRIVNDIHSQLNSTRVARIVSPTRVSEIQAAIGEARNIHKPVCVAGGRHAMGGQQFCNEAVLIDMRQMNEVGDLDSQRGLIEVQAGAFWPVVIDVYLARQKGLSKQWGIAQKQTGADRLSVAGTLAANAHGRGLTMKPFVSDVESFSLVNSEGDEIPCNRKQNPELYAAPRATAKNKTHCRNTYI